MAETGKYIYGVIHSNGPIFLKEVGGVRIYTIPDQDVSAIVSDKEIVDYTRMPKDAGVRLLLGHERVIEEMMGLGYVILPMRLGTFAADESEVKDVLRKGYRVIKAIMEKISDKIEIDVIATYSDFVSVLKEAGEEEEIKEFKERLLTDQKGITADDQIKVGVMVKGHLDAKREKYASKIRDVLKTVSQDLRIHALMDDRMVMNTAFLIHKDRYEAFNRKVEEVNHEFAERLNFKCVGPLPPYSFYTLEINRIEFSEIAWAREKLGLNDFTTKDEIKKAYHRSAFSSHPDRRPDAPGMEKEFDRVTKAYKILVDYCAAVEQAGGGDQKKNTIFVKVRE